MFTAVVRISGAGRLADFRERLRWLMVRDAEAEDYTEHHADGVLEYRFTPRKGIPFPAFAEASSDFPELRVEASWEHDGVRGRAVIENGRVLQDEDVAPAADAVEVRLGERGELLLGAVMRPSGAATIGYAVSAGRHTFFRWQGADIELLDVEEPPAELEELAFGFVDEWIWYDEEDAPLERARYADYGYPVRGANLRPDKLALLRRRGEPRYSTLDDAQKAVLEALARKWQKKA
ncbi:MAG: hypothetical protein ACT4P4_15145 [Betaproteobacteria bacterium]